MRSLPPQECSVNLCERSEVPPGIAPSMVAVWSQFLDYEATVPEISLTDATMQVFRAYSQSLSQGASPV